MMYHLASLASRLASAAERRSPLRIADFPKLPEKEAYEVQRLLVESLCRRGSRRVAGFKISMTSPETQALAGASEPAFGTLISDMILESPATLSLNDCFDPLLELEIQFIVDQALSVGARRAEIEASCSVAPGLEVPDARFRAWYGNLSLGHLVADNAVAGRVVVGAPIPLSHLRTLRGVEGHLYVNDEAVARGTGLSVMGDPVIALEWLTEKLATKGRALEHGMVVSSGTLCMPVPARPGTYVARFSELGDVKLSVHR